MSISKRRVALVTGGSRGIGRAVCLEFARRGMQVYTCARNRDGISETQILADEYDGSVHGEVADVTDVAMMEQLFERVQADEGRLDILVNNAGILGPKAPIADVDLEAWQNTLSINLDGVFIASKLSLDLLQQSEAGLMLNVSSSVGRRGRGGWGPYAVSKHGVEGLTDTLADELEDAGVCVVSVNPGGTATDMRHKAYPDEDPATIPSPARIAQTFTLLAEHLDVAQTGRKYNSRDLLDYVGDEVGGEDLPHVG